jgi:hypothetical protein
VIRKLERSRVLMTDKTVNIRSCEATSNGSAKRRLWYLENFIQRENDKIYFIKTSENIVTKVRVQDEQTPRADLSAAERVCED